MWNFEVNNYKSGANQRKGKVEEMLAEFRHMHDQTVSNKKKEQMNMATTYISSKTTMAFASSLLKGMDTTQTVPPLY